MFMLVPRFPETRALFMAVMAPVLHATENSPGFHPNRTSLSNAGLGWDGSSHCLLLESERRGPISQSATAAAQKQLEGGDLEDGDPLNNFFKKIFSQVELGGVGLRQPIRHTPLEVATTCTRA
jgi:hypothetical protein